MTELTIESQPFVPGEWFVTHYGIEVRLLGLNREGMVELEDRGRLITAHPSWMLEWQRLARGRESAPPRPVGEKPAAGRNGGRATTAPAQAYGVSPIQTAG